MSDYIVRATAAKAQIRAFACLTTETVETARAAHNTSPVMTAALGRLLSAGAMMGSMLKGEDEILTLMIRGEGPGMGLTVTADSGARVKGYALNPDVCIPAKPNGKLDVSGALGPGTLTVIKDLGLKEPYSGQVDLVSGEIAEDLTYYFATSEQVPSCVGLGVLMNKENTVRVAGGFIVQLMPFADDDVIDKLEANLAKVSSVTTILNAGATPEELLAIVLDGLEMEINDTIPTEFYCNCSKDRVEKALISIGTAELQSMIDDGKPVELNCHFCNRSYGFSVDDLKGILEAVRQ